jgi:hypothetical protein
MTKFFVIFISAFLAAQGAFAKSKMLVVQRPVDAEDHYKLFEKHCPNVSLDEVIVNVGPARTIGQVGGALGNALKETDAQFETPFNPGVRAIIIDVNYNDNKNSVMSFDAVQVKTFSATQSLLTLVDAKGNVWTKTFTTSAAKEEVVFICLGNRDIATSLVTNVTSHGLSGSRHEVGITTFDSVD